MLIVMSFNIASGKRIDGELDLELTAQTIEKGNADVVGLQEVDRNFSSRSGFLDQAKWLAKRLGMEMAYGPNLVHRGAGGTRPKREYGNATLSRYPIVSWRNHDLSAVEVHPEKFEPRGMLETVIDTGESRFSFYNTHLSLIDREIERNLTEILAIVKRNPLPQVVVGDFNTAPSTGHIKRFTKHFYNAFGSGPYPDTYKKQGNHGKVIDYIFHDAYFQAVEAWTIKSDASDHAPIAAKLINLQKSNKL
ncbi:MAG: endonuclease/exonuclease/phosphatase family protein [Bacillota bacterium]